MIINVYFVLLMLISTGYCRAFDDFHPYRLYVHMQTIFHFSAAAQIPIAYGIIVREIGITTCRLASDKVEELRLTVHFHFRLLTVWCTQSNSALNVLKTQKLFSYA